MSSIVALIPARAGSKRVPGKNTKELFGKPLMQWTIDAAKESGIFADIIVCSDDSSLAKGAPTFFGRESVTDSQPDIVWVRQVLNEYDPRRCSDDAFAILRPTSPFRTATTIRRAWEFFQNAQPCDSLRAIEPVKQHPAKMWTVDATTGLLVSLLPYKHPDGTPWHSSPTQSLKTFYVQNSSLEIAWVKTVRETGTISGNRIWPFYTEGDEGFSIDYPEDWDTAVRKMAALKIPDYPPAWI